MVHISESCLVNARDVREYLVLAPLVKHLHLGVKSDSRKLLAGAASWAEFPMVVSNLANLMSMAH